MGQRCEQQLLDQQRKIVSCHVLYPIYGRAGKGGDTVVGRDGGGPLAPSAVLSSSLKTRDPVMNRTPPWTSMEKLSPELG